MPLSTIAGMRLFGAILRKAGANCSSLLMSIAMRLIGQTDLLKHDGCFAAVRRPSGVKVDHVCFLGFVIFRNIGTGEALSPSSIGRRRL